MTTASETANGGGVDLTGKKVLVTGASSGIGAAFAQELASVGAVVGICARRRDRLEKVLASCTEHSPDSRMWAVDLSELDSLADFARQVDDEMGGVDVLVNNAGIPKRRALLDLTPAVVDQVMAINYLSPVRLTLALLPRMIERGFGRIVNVSSVAAKLSPPHEAAYAASKAAMTAFSETMAVDLADTPVRIHTVYPGIIDTELFHLPDNEPSMAGDSVEAVPAEEMARAMREQLESGALELYVPSWFGDVCSGKAQDVEAFLEGTKAWIRTQQGT
jgi:NAD(P)-dependent dehydrogenase (short-subunit alcohol dehydrogenase family)